jgi:IS5 family transposase
LSMTQISRFTNEIVPISQRITGDGDESAVPEGGGFADYALVSLHCLRIYLDTSYRMTIDLFKEVPQIIGEIGLDRANTRARVTRDDAWVPPLLLPRHLRHSSR